MEKIPKIFTIILNYNGNGHVIECLRSVIQSNYPNLEIVFVDNNSQDGSLEEAKITFPKINFIKNPKNIGFAAGVNIGIRFALEKMADYVFLLNPDAIIEKNTIRGLAGVYKKNQNIGIVAPVIWRKGVEKIWFSGGQISWLRMKALHQREPIQEKTYKTKYVSGCATMIKKEVFKRVGLFDENYFLYYEDADFCLRARKAGFYTVVTGEARAEHAEKSELDKKSKTYWLVLSGLIFFRKNTPFLCQPWVKFYFFLRRLKNKMDIAGGKKELAKIVQKAYDDFEKFKIN